MSTALLILVVGYSLLVAVASWKIRPWHRKRAVIGSLWFGGGALWLLVLVAIELFHGIETGSYHTFYDTLGALAIFLGFYVGLPLFILRIVERNKRRAPTVPLPTITEAHHSSLIPVHKVQRPEQRETCPSCGEPLIKRSGQFGSFYGCKGYPKCNYTKSPRRAADKDIGRK